MLRVILQLGFGALAPFSAKVTILPNPCTKMPTMAQLHMHVCAGPALGTSNLKQLYAGFQSLDRVTVKVTETNFALFYSLGLYRPAAAEHQDNTNHTHPS